MNIDRRACLALLALPQVAPALRPVRRSLGEGGADPRADTQADHPATPSTTPRLLFTRDELTRVRARAGHPQLVRFRDGLMARADALLTAPPLVPSITRRGEPDPPGEDKGLACARALQGRVLSLGMAWELTGEDRYLERAVINLEQAVRDWRIWVDTAHQPPFDLMTGELSLTYGLAIDWLLPAIDEARRTAIIDGVVRRGLDTYLEAVERPTPPGWHTARHNWNTVCNGGAVMLSLALEPSSPAADKAARALARAVPAMDHYWNHLGDDGAWDEGTGYWRYGHRYALMAAEALRRTGHPAGAAVFARPGVRRTGYFPIVFNPGRTLSASFGDSNGRASDAIFYLLGATYRDPAFIWYQDRVPVNASRVGWPDEALALLWRPVDEPWLPEQQRDYRPDVPTAAVFPSIGWALLAPSQPDPPHFLAFKNGSLSANHTHLDLNHVSVGVGDQLLITELGSRPYPADYFRAERRYGYYEISTRGHNTVLVDGRGQVHRRDGRLLPLATSGDVRVLTGVADGTYEIDVPTARRHVCTIGSDIYLVIDQIETPAPRTIEMRWHSAGAWALDDRGAAVVTSGGERAAMRMAALAGQPALTVESPDGWIRPVSVLRAESTAATRHLVATVIVPNAAAAPSLSLAAPSDGTGLEVTIGERRQRFTLTADRGLQPV